MKFILLITLLFSGFLSFAQSAAFHYKTSSQQYFRIRPGTDKFYHPINLRTQDIVTNTLFTIDENKVTFKIPEDGFYEITAMYHFNANTSNVRYNRGGVNFGIVQTIDKGGIYVAATRMSFDKSTQDKFIDIYVQPTIVYLQKDVEIYPAISSGLMANPLLGCEIGCEKKNKNCTSFEFKIKRISNEKSFQRYY